ncbi:MAG: hypothetical protein K0M49_02330 [Arenimonas sp.]|nr:hypothetical protein [Rhizobium sp.]MBW8444444.1 hypothetical protein [Arenimonas sp.]
MGDRYRYRDRIGTKQEWLIVGILFLGVLLPAIGISGFAYLVVQFLSWVTGISPVRVLVIIAIILFVWGLLRYARRGRP